MLFLILPFARVYLFFSFQLLAGFFAFAPHSKSSAVFMKTTPFFQLQKSGNFEEGAKEEGKGSERNLLREDVRKRILDFSQRRQ